MVDFNPSFVAFIETLCWWELGTLTMQGLGLMMGTMFQVGHLMTVMILVLTLMFVGGGLFVPFDQMQWTIKWLFYINPQVYGNTVVLDIVFPSLTFDCAPAGEPTAYPQYCGGTTSNGALSAIPGGDFVSDLGFRFPAGLCVMAVLIFFFFFRLGTYLTLFYKWEYVPGKNSVAFEDSTPEKKTMTTTTTAKAVMLDDGSVSNVRTSELTRKNSKFVADSAESQNSDR